MPSVMVIISLMPASIASRMEALQNGAGTSITDAVAPVAATASRTVLNTGRPRWVVPPLPGVTPPTILVPYAMACSEWKVPWLPVKPWQITLVFLSIKMDIISPPLRQQPAELHPSDLLLQ